MQLVRMGERWLIEHLMRQLPARAQGVAIGPGDDCAMIRPARGRAWLLTTDQLIEGVHFRWAWSRPEQLGYRAGAITLSDIAAMGGRPRYLLISLGLPARTTLATVDRFYRGLRAILSRHDVKLIGGDTAASPIFHAAMTAVGEAVPSRAVDRAGAVPGDLVMVTGTLGDAAAGLNLLRTASRRGRVGRLLTGMTPTGLERGVRRLVQRHLFPQPRLMAGRWLARRRLATAMQDLSDGLLIDLDRLCAASRVGAAVVSEQLPLSPAMVAYGRRGRVDPVRLALTGGEDYELLFTIRPSSLRRCVQLLRRAGVRCSPIGWIRRRGPGPLVRVERNGRWHTAGRYGKVGRGGYDHFLVRSTS